MNQQRTAFTLMELLIVVAIIGLLAGLLLPVMGIVKRSARSTACASALRQVGLGFMAHTADNQNRIARVRSTNDLGWIQTISPYVESASSSSDYQRRSGEIARSSKADVMWGCPEYQYSAIRKEYAEGAVPFYYNGYGMNGWLASESGMDFPARGQHNYFADLAQLVADQKSQWAPRDFRISSISMASTRLLVTDSVEDWTGNGGLGGFAANPIIITEQRHAGKGNILFIDGHVAAAIRDVVHKAITDPDVQ